MPLMPAPLLNQDGATKNDGARQAAPRFIAPWRQDHPHGKCLVTEDRLRANAPHIETLQAHARHSLRGGKEGAHAWLFQPVQAAEHAGHGPSDEPHDRAAGLLHRLRLVNDVPLTASNPDVRVNGIASWEMGRDTVRHCRWVTDLRVSRRHGLRLMRGGRARWQIDNETCNTLNNQGDNVEHPYGHGTQHLSVVCAAVMMLALLVDQTQQRCGAFCRAGWTKWGSQRRLWERRRAWCDASALKSMRQLLATRLYGLKKLHPLLAVDSSCCPAMRGCGPPPETPGIPSRVGQATPR
jgi:hypothetical protein